MIKFEEVKLIPHSQGKLDQIVANGGTDINTCTGTLQSSGCPIVTLATNGGCTHPAC